jgi:hypothetical protein
MREAMAWQEFNSSYLAQAMAWLRMRLERLARNEGTSTEAKKTELDSQSQLSLGSPSDVGSMDGEVQKATQAMAAAEAEVPPPALIALSRLLGLSRFEMEVIMLCTAMEQDTLMPYLCARAQGDSAKGYPTFALAMALFDEPAWDVLSPERPLRRWHLIEIHQNATGPLISSPLRADERIVNYIKGLNYLDDRLTPLLMPIDVSYVHEALPPSQSSAVKAIVHCLRQGSESWALPVVQLLGRDGLSKQTVAMHAAGDLGLDLCRVPVEILPSQPSEIETMARLWQRESLLIPIALYIDAHDTGQRDAPASLAMRLLSRLNCVTFLDVSDVWNIPGRESFAHEISKPTEAEQKEAWKSALCKDDEAIPSLLSGQFSLSLSAIQRISREAVSGDSGDGLCRRIWGKCLESTRPGLDALACRIDAKATWDDLILPEAEERILRQISDQVSQRSLVYGEWGFGRKMNRGLGISALFAGDSGTGKTMAAEVIANDLDLNLFRIDLSAVVSKYIGETEKNLRRVFDAAEDGGAILLFDEADALFGRRSEVKDSHDRYANIEINYLLQRIEAYRGLAILATNMKGALDKAFLRRLRFIVNFPFPDASQRREIWERAFPQDVPRMGLDLSKLSGFNLTGGSIHSIALSSAFMAAGNGGVVTMPLVLEAVRAEFRKLERPINEADFRWREQ